MPCMSRLGPAPRWTPRITHEVVDQVLASRSSLENQAPAIRSGPRRKQPPGVLLMNHHRLGKPVLAEGRSVVGIDIGKRKHAATALSPQGEIIAQLASFPNTREGVDQLENEVLRKAGGPGRVLVAMEATGHYWMCLRAELE